MMNLWTKSWQTIKKEVTRNNVYVSYYRNRFFDSFASHGSQNYSGAKYGTFDGKPAKIHPDKCRNHESWLNVLYSDKGDFRLDHDHGHVLLDEKW